jgi:vacuolar-type H+-ATPase subunit C/Vma6
MLLLFSTISHRTGPMTKFLEQREVDVKHLTYLISLKIETLRESIWEERIKESN